MGGHAQLPEEPGDGFAALALFETIASEFSPYPFVQALEFSPASRKAVVGEPANDEQIEFDDHLRETDAPVSTGDLPDLFLGAFDAFGGDPEFTVEEQPVAEKLSFPDRSPGALSAVDSKFEFPFQKPSSRIHPPLPRR